MNKPGGASLDSAIIVEAAHKASLYSKDLHLELANALTVLEKEVLTKRQKDIEVLRLYRIALEKENDKLFLGKSKSELYVIGCAGGIDRDDVILDWNNINCAAGLRKE
jgi:hypothetical protein